MADKNCAACSDLETYAPDFVLNGVTKTVDASLKNDTGFNPKNSRNDCTDLNDAADCLIGNMETDIDEHDTCDWKTYLHELVPNIYNMFKAIISAICGIWTNYHRLRCEVNFLYQGYTFSLKEDQATGNANSLTYEKSGSDKAHSYVVAGKGISFLNAVANVATHTAEISLRYIAGGLMQGGGSLLWYTDVFTENGGKYCWSFDNSGADPTWSNSRQGNSVFGTTGKPAAAGELLYEIRLKKADFPQINDIFSGFGHEGDGSAYRVNVKVFDGDSKSADATAVWAYGQHGSCNGATGVPDNDGYSPGHSVPAGWWFVQVRMNYNEVAFENGHQYTPQYFIGARMNQSEVPC